MKTTKLLLAGLMVVGAGFLFSACTTGEIPNQAASTLYFPDPTGYVIDEADVLSPTTETELTNKLSAMDEQAQIAVVTLETTKPLDEASYAVQLAEKWGVGHEGEDNGVLFLIVTGDRRLRIEVGRGLEDELTDSEAGRILDAYVVPALKENNWEKGITDGVDAIIKEVK